MVTQHSDGSERNPGRRERYAPRSEIPSLQQHCALAVTARQAGPVFVDPLWRPRQTAARAGTLRDMTIPDDVARRRNLAALGFALVFPTLITVMYFIVLAGNA